MAVARRLEDLAVCASGLDTGELSEDQLAVIARHAPSHVDAEVAELARHTTVAQLGRVLRRYSFDADSPEPGEPPVPEEERRQVFFSMWRIESDVASGRPARSTSDRRAAIYDGLVRCRLYNRIAWSTSPHDYTGFSQRAFVEGSGPLLEVGAGAASATAALHARSSRTTVLVDLSRPMLERAGRHIAAYAGDGQFPQHRARLLQADLLRLTPGPERFGAVLALGLAHLFDDLPAVLIALREQLAAGGRLYLAGLVTETRRARHYLGLLHRVGEVAAPRTAEELRAQLGDPPDFHLRGCMAYATFASPVTD